MKSADRYAKIVQWSEEDGCFVGALPDFCGACCHGPDAASMFDELCQIAEEWVEIFERDGRPLPPPMNWVSAHDDEGAPVSATIAAPRLQRPG